MVDYMKASQEFRSLNERNGATAPLPGLSC